MPSRLIAALAAAAAVVGLAVAASPSTALTSQSANAVSSVSGADASSPQDGEVSDLDAGHASPPTRDVAKVKAEQEAAGATNGTKPSSGSPTSGSTSGTTGAVTAAGDTTGYRSLGMPITHLSEGYRPYDDQAIVPIGGDGTRDATGVRMFTFVGSTTLWNHPVGQAQYSIRNSNSYRLTKNQVYLDRAIANAQRLIDRKVVSNGGWYYPYDFDFAVHGDTTQTLQAPWYSGMAEGQAISAFVRLAELTNDPKWREAADFTLQALVNAPVAGLPFASWVDSDKHLWLEEYPRPQITNSERVLNGHIYAIFGLYDYWQLTGDTRALTVMQGAMTTAEELILTKFRRANGPSVYSLRHLMPTMSYHHIHIDQMLKQFQMTQRPRFITFANIYRQDFPWYRTTGTARLTPSARTAYKINESTRTVTSSKSVTFVKTTGAPADRRTRTTNGPIMLRLSAGSLSGSWFPEGVNKTWLLGPIEPKTFAPRAVNVVFTPATYYGYRYDSAGTLISVKKLVITHNSTAPTGREAFLVTRPSYYFMVGAWAGYWVPITSTLINK